MTILSAIAANQLRIILVQVHWLSVGIPLSVEFRFGPTYEKFHFSGPLSLTAKGFAAKAFRCFLLVFLKFSNKCPMNHNFSNMTPGFRISLCLSVVFSFEMFHPS